MGRFLLGVSFTLVWLTPLLAADRPLELIVDATQAHRKLFHARMVIPAQPGPLTLYYPKWIQGEHGPNGPINDLAGLKITAAGKPVAWTRDDLDNYAFHCTVPDGETAVDVSFEYLGATSGSGFTTSLTATSKLAIINWHLLVMYPKGTPVRDLPVKASLILPPDWKAGTAAPVSSVRDNTVQFETVSLEKLCDSPALCGLHFKEIPIGPTTGPKHSIVVAADSAAALVMPPELKAKYDKLVVESGALFGCRHYGSYRFLLTLSDAIPEVGVEHHESSDNRAKERLFLDDSFRKSGADGLLPHEFVHSWNGKFRRPGGLATADFQLPMRTKHLWIYEGLTQYLGYVLVTRSGLASAEEMREGFAGIADWAANRGGRQWRSLEDTATAAPFLYNAAGSWGDRRRGVDFYDEGALIWLDADTLIREKSGGKRSLDDFCRVFFGGPDGKPEVKPYELDEVITALNSTAEHDWKTFLADRVTAVRKAAPLDGLTRGGWKLVYSTTPSDTFKAKESQGKRVDLGSSIGLKTDEDGIISDVIRGKAADTVRLGPGMKIVAVNGRKWNADRLRDAVAECKKTGTIALLIESHEQFDTYKLEYGEGAKFPLLERNEAKPDLFGAILAPAAK